MIPFSLNTSNFKRPVRQRIKREVVDVPMVCGKVEDLVSSLKVSGTKAWAKMAPGSIKIVKRVSSCLHCD
jgi:hypothetical protein